MTEQQFVDMIQEAMMYIISFYMFIILMCALICYALFLADKYGFKWKYFKNEKKA